MFSKCQCRRAVGIGIQLSSLIQAGLAETGRMADIALEPIWLEAGKRILHIENIVPEVAAGLNPAWIALVYPGGLAASPTWSAVSTQSWDCNLMPAGSRPAGCAFNYQSVKRREKYVCKAGSIVF